ncbi:MAG: hypothetical protein COA59_08500 [Colwellia sp.]|jgi:hypothetical protein|nr:MAG: hypothetical protein COA59_08500 [Colwellia sp.]
MIKALVFINGCSGEYAPAFSSKLHPCSVLKKRSNNERDLLIRPRRASLKGLYATLLISTRKQPFSLINALPLNLLILVETSISR